MLVGIDHAVLATSDLDATAADLERRLGLAATGGGRHDAVGTVNRLVWLGDSYLELVDVFDRDLAGQSWFGQLVLDALERGGGLVTWAIAVDDLDEALRWAPPDSGYVGPLDGERRRTDGRLVRWRLARLDPSGPTTPFLIEHDNHSAEWTPAERSARADEHHPVGARVRLTSIEVATPSLVAAGARLRSLLAVRVEPAGRAAVRVRLGPHEVRFVAARAGAVAVVDLVAETALRTRVGHVGDCEVRLRGMPVEAGAAAQPGEETDV